MGSLSTRLSEGVLWVPLVLAAVLIGQSCTVYDAELLTLARGESSLEDGSSGGESSMTPPGIGGIPVNSGGVPGGGGESSSGGGTGGAEPNTGGAEATTGGSSTGGGPVVNPVKFAFAEDLEGFFISSEQTSGGSSSTATWDAAQGDPETGSVQLDLSTAGPNESVEFTREFATPLDLGGTQLTARVKLDSGLSGNPLCRGAAYILAKSGPSFVYARGAWLPLSSADGWSTLSMDLEAPALEDGVFDAADVREFGVGLATGDASCASPDWQSAQIHVDTIDY